MLERYNKSILHVYEKYDRERERERGGELAQSVNRLPVEPKKVGSNPTLADD